jgi:hypothetical protein
VKRLLFLGTALFSVVQFCSAAACTGGTLANYLALGSSGCTIGGDTLSNFQILEGITGATAIAAGDIAINTNGGSYNPTLMFTTNQTANAGGLLEAIFTYKISGPSYNSSAISLAKSSETGDGGVTEIENFCAGGSFGPDGVDGCTGSSGSLLTLDGIQNQDQSTFSPAFFLQVTDDFTLDGGTAGSATGGVFTNSFTATPEPASLSLGALGLAFAAAFRSYLRRNK